MSLFSKSEQIERLKTDRKELVKKLFDIREVLGLAPGSDVVAEVTALKSENERLRESARADLYCPNCGRGLTGDVHKCC